MLLRLPPQAAEGKNIPGMVCYCSWQSDPDSIRANLEAEQGAFSYLMRYADQKGFAILTWTTATLWNPGKNYDAYSPKAYVKLDDGFDLVATAWENGLLQLAGKYGVPKEKLLISGMSRGAQWAHRLVLAKPGRFLAIHAHIASSYAKPLPEAQNIFWLVTTGQSEPGYPLACKFYHDCMELGYPIVFKAQENLGHTTSGLEGRLEIAYFDYALGIQKQIDDHFDQNAGTLRMADFLKPPFIGDFVNNAAFPSSEAEMVPETQKVCLPTKEIAETWGPILK